LTKDNSSYCFKNSQVNFLIDWILWGDCVTERALGHSWLKSTSNIIIKTVDIATDAAATAVDISLDAAQLAVNASLGIFPKTNQTCPDPFVPNNSITYMCSIYQLMNCNNEALTWASKKFLSSEIDCDAYYWCVSQQCYGGTQLF